MTFFVAVNSNGFILLLIVTGIAIIKQKLNKSLAEETESEDSSSGISESLFSVSIPIKYQPEPPLFYLDYRVKRGWFFDKSNETVPI